MELDGIIIDYSDVVNRIEAVETSLARLVEGSAGFLVDHRCINLKKGFNGGYFYRRMQTSGDRYDEKPMKNRYSHVHDALQYLLLGAGEGKQLISGKAKNPTVVKTRGWSIFGDKKRKSVWQNRMKEATEALKNLPTRENRWVADEFSKWTNKTS